MSIKRWANYIELYIQTYNNELSSNNKLASYPMLHGHGHGHRHGHRHGDTAIFEK